MPNDVLMFTPSGLSIAMGNASTEVQAAADHVTTSNQDEGFANAVERFVLPTRVHAVRARLDPTDASSVSDSAHDNHVESGTCARA